jgi:hypothetical protein
MIKLQHGDLALDEPTAAIMAAVGCLLTVAESIAEQEPENATLLRAVARRLVVKIDRNVLEEIVGFAVAVVQDACASERPAAGKAH